MFLKDKLIQLTIFSFLVYIITLLTFRNYYVSLVFVLLQDLVLLFFCYKNDIIKFNIIFCIFLALSFETSSYFEQSDIVFYGFKNLNFFGLSNSLIIILVCSFIFFVRNFTHIKKYIKSNYKNAKALSVFLLLTCTSIVIGLLNLIIGDNGARLSSEYLSVYFGEAYYGVFTLLNVFLFILPFTKYKKSLIYKWYFFTIIAVLLANCYVPYLAYLIGIRGGYGGSLIFTLSKFALPFLILAPFSYRFRCKYFIYFSWFVGNIIPIIFFQAGTGKEILFLVIAIIAFIFLFIWKKTHQKYIVIMAAIISIVISYFVLNRIAMGDTRLADKANQLQAMITFWKSDWLLNMPNSPKVRIYELISTFIELFNKPIYLLLGKGYGGSFTDWTGYFSTIEDARKESVFSLFEFENNYFYRVHETIIRLPLDFGLIGIFFVFYLVIERIKKIDMCSIMGCIWLLLFMNNSQTLTVLLIMAYFTVPSGIISRRKISEKYDKRGCFIYG